MAINGRRVDIDFCIADIVAALNAANITTSMSCCGHGKQNGAIVLDDGRVLHIYTSCSCEFNIKLCPEHYRKLEEDKEKAYES